MASSVFIPLLIILTIITNNANAFACDPMLLGDVLCTSGSCSAQNSSITAIEFDSDTSTGNFVYLGGFLQDITHMSPSTFSVGLLNKTGISSMYTGTLGVTYVAKFSTDTGNYVWMKSLA